MLDRAIAEERRGEPELHLAAAICIRAWHDLGTCRGVGMALGPIPVTAIFAWCELEGFDREATMILRDVVRTADNERAEREASRQRLKNLTGGR
ncbi:MAG: hypothetical protein E6J91_53375 [Deltaproteobacteria bacterium]|nr:MAG: hypothetical protein E6J91_53375 [Deltaproteobacteria bacterium]